MQGEFNENYRHTDDEAHYRYAMRKKALEISCYVIGAGAFSVFVRWLQLMLAYNDDGLVDKSVFNVLVILMIAAGGYVFLRFVDKFRNNRYFVPDDFFAALSNPGKLYAVLRTLIGLIMIVGAILLLSESETDKDDGFYRVLAIAGLLTGLSFPLMLSAANRPHVTKINFVCLCGFMPILFFCIWLVVCYKVNSINSVMWDYAPEALAVIVSIIAFFRLAGFAFGAPNAWRAMFFSMLAAMLDLMMLADSRYIGQQLMFFATAMMLAMCNWLMICNMGRREKEKKKQPDDGFERL